MNEWEKMLILSNDDEYCALEVTRDFARSHAKYLYSIGETEEANKEWARYKEAQKKMKSIERQLELK
ncbi:MAG: hypothetical protein J6I69_02260 [Bacilli bacterium]|nr:hypothetical protein [Bacilli bacterium]